MTEDDGGARRDGIAVGAEVVAMFEQVAFNIASSAETKAQSQVEWEIVEAQKSAYAVGAEARTGGGWQDDEVARLSRDLEDARTAIDGYVQAVSAQHNEIVALTSDLQSARSDRETATAHFLSVSERRDALKALIPTLRARISSREFREAPGGNFVITSNHADGMLDEIEELISDPLPSAPTETKKR